MLFFFVNNHNVQKIDAIFVNIAQRGNRMKPETSTNYKKIVDDVLDQINRGRLQKGDKLPTELCLATQFDVSRTCVREAIKRLEAMGIVQSIQGSGSYITNTPELSINRPICALFALSNGTLENVLDLRIVLETDSPYMAPVPFRGKRNESAFVLEVLKTLAKAYGVSEEEFAKQTNETVERVFHIE